MTSYEQTVLKVFNGETHELHAGNAVKAAIKNLQAKGYLSSGSYPYVTEDGKEFLNDL